MEFDNLKVKDIFHSFFEWNKAQKFNLSFTRGKNLTKMRKKKKIAEFLNMIEFKLANFVFCLSIVKMSWWYQSQIYMRVGESQRISDPWFQTLDFRPLISDPWMIYSPKNSPPKFQTSTPSKSARIRQRTTS
jgi:hypothetical protein